MDLKERLLLSFSMLVTLSSMSMVVDLLPVKTLIQEVEIDLPVSNVCKKAFNQIAKDAQVPPVILYGVIKTESNFIPRARNRNRNGSIDRGMGQINSFYQKEFEQRFWRSTEKFNVYNPEHSLELSAKILQWLYKSTGNWKHTIIAYNRGLNYIRLEDHPNEDYYQKVASNIKQLLVRG